MMTGQSRQLLMMLGIFLALSFWLIFPGRAAAHCDALDGPVITEARDAAVHGAPHHAENPSEPSHQH